MQEKRIRRVSYGNARPRRDFPLLARAYLDGQLMLDEIISRRITLDDVNDGFAALKRGETIVAPSPSTSLDHASRALRSRSSINPCLLDAVAAPSTDKQQNKWSQLED
jgi:hypothetical protein